MNLPPPPPPATPPPPPPPATSCWPALPGVRIQPLGGLVTALTMLLGAGTLSAAVTAVAFVNRTSVVDDFLDGRSVSLSEVDNADNFVQGTTLLYLLLFVAAGIVFIVWQYRFAANAERFTGRLGLRPPWAIGGWFIPLAAPILAALQLNQADERSGERQPSGGRATGLVLAWLVTLYAGWVLSGVANAVRPDLEEGDGEPRDFARADRLSSVGFALVAVAGFLAILMVRKLSARQRDAAGPLAG